MTESRSVFVCGGGGAGTEARGSDYKEAGGNTGVMDMFIILTVMVVSLAYTYVKTSNFTF